jgi:class 3 adenylate cyclase/tetratricopeptide (TPR) repeat protein
VRCQVCNSENPASAKFCMECGAPAARRCEGCGAELPAGAKFCMECGRAVAVATVEPVPRQTPTSYTPKHLADKILGSRVAMEGERKQVTVLFADVTGSMALSDQIDAEEWHRILDQFFGILSRGVYRYEGIVNQFTGDGIMALFGAPIAHENHAQRACYAALTILEEIESFAEEVRRRHGLNFSVRIGINSGEVIVGKIGDDLRMDYTAQGHAVGIAARVESLAAPNSAYVTDHTATLVAGYLALRDLGEFSLKGVREPLRVWRLEGVGTAKTRLDVSRARGLSRFVGRRAEIAKLEEALAKARRGERQVIGVFGEAGAGKSRLCAEFMERARRESIATYEAHCVPHGEMIPFLPALELLRGYMNLNEREDPRTQREKIAGRVLLIDSKMAEGLPLVFDFMGIADPDNPPPALDPQVRSRILFEHLKLLLDAVASKNPSIVMWEDLHWIDGGSDGFLAEYVELTAAMPVLVIANSRPGYRAPWMAEEYYTEIAVGPLSADDLREMLAELLGGDDSVQPLADRIAEQTAGNPFFVEEVVRGLAESGVISGKPGAYVLVRDADVSIPPTVHAVLAARIDRLGEEDKLLLEIAAVIGKRFDEAMLREVSAIEPDDLRAGLDRLSEAGFIALEEAYPDPVYVFQHPLTQEVAYRTQLGEARASIHRKVAEALEGRCTCGDGRDEIAGLLAHHWDGAGDVLRAVTWRKRAAEWAASRDLREAERHWQSVRDLLSRCPQCPESIAVGIVAREALMEIAWKLGRSLAETQTLFDEGVALARRAQDLAAETRLVAAFAMAELFAGNVERGLARIEAVAKAASAIADRALSVRLDGRIAYMNILSGRLADALEVLDRVLGVGDSAVYAEAGTAEWFAAFRALPLTYLGRLEEAASTLDVAFERVRTVNDPAGLGTMCGLAVTVAWFRGDAGVALTYAQEQVRIAERLQTPTLLAGAYDSLGVACLLSERFHDALELTERALNVARRAGTLLQSEAVFVANLAAAYVGVGELEKGIQHAREAVTIARERHTPLFECRALLVCVRALLAGGVDHLEEAEEALASAFAIVNRTGARGYEPFLRIEAAKLARLRGDVATSVSELEKASRQFDSMGARGHAAKTRAEEPAPAA